MKIQKDNRLIKIKKTILKKNFNIRLENNELITFKFKKNQEYDFVKKNWGYYVSPSINHRLRKNKFKIALIENRKKKFFICALSIDKLREFKKYLKEDNQKIIAILNPKNIQKLNEK